jgi:hypothetical protein
MTPLELARHHWNEAQNNLSDIQVRLIALTGEQCGTSDNLNVLQWRLANYEDCLHEGKRALAERDAEIAKLRAILARSVEWWLREGMHQFSGAPEWLFAARNLEEK